MTPTGVKGDLRPGARVHTRAQLGVDAPPVMAEAHFAAGSPAFSLVGMAEVAVRESRERVRSAIETLGLQFPEGRIIVNLAPADLPKNGGRYDLAIAVALLVASGQVSPRHVERLEFLGELSLFGELRPVRGLLCAVAADTGRALVMPAVQARELQSLGSVRAYPMKTLEEVVEFLSAEELSRPREYRRPRQKPAQGARRLSLNDIRGQLVPKRALTIAAAGGHHMLMVGPPGTGKTMLARRLAALLPPPADHEMVDIARIFSAAGKEPPTTGERPFRDPHHSASTPAIIGGGKPVSPGEVSLADQGVLFLDELPEFRRDVLEALREPLEGSSISIARAGQQLRFPSRFQLIAAMNPCPSGTPCVPARCRCSAADIHRYQSKISGPLLDRMDLTIRVEAPSDRETWDSATPPIDEEDLRFKIRRAARAQQLRGFVNRDVPPGELDRICPLTESAVDMLKNARRSLELSMRAIHRIRRVARTIADLDAAITQDTEARASGEREARSDSKPPPDEVVTKPINETQIAEALRYRLTAIGERVLSP